MRNQYSHQTSRITDFQMHGIQNSRNGRIAVTSFTVHGQNAMPTRSFWKWLIRQFADTEITDEAEFWNRLQRQHPKAEIEYEIIWDEDGNAMLQAPLERVADESSTNSQRNRITQLSIPPTERLFMTSPPGTPRFSLN